MLTLFALPKAFEGHIGVIQRNAIRSWTLLLPRPEIVLLGDEPGTAEFAQEMHLKHEPQIARNEYGTPLISDIFSKAQETAPCGILAYVNSDIMLMSDFSEAVAQARATKKNFLMAGQRWTVDLPYLWDFGPNWEARLREHVAAHGSLDPPHSIDYFIFPAGLWKDIPAFAIGRFFWDNWLLYEARRQGAALVQATGTVMAVHQSHGYQHAATTGDALHQGPEAQRNLELAGGSHHLCSLNQATHLMTRQGVRRRPAGRWQIEAWQQRWNHRSREAVRSWQGQARSNPLARALLWTWNVTTTPRQKIGRAVTVWRKQV